MIRLLTLIFPVLFVLAFALPASAQSPIVVQANTFTNNFPRQLVFQVDAQSTARITQVALVAQLDGLPSSTRQLPEFTAENRISAKYEWHLGRNYLPPGVTGQFWWTLEDTAGNRFETPKQSFRVEDTNHQWRKMSNERLALYWYAGGDSFGKALYDRAIEAMNFLERDTGVKVDRQVQVWIYGNRADFFRALEPGAREWTGGRAFSNYSIVMINVEPSQLEWGKGATTHELTHVIVHQRIRSPLGDLSMPRWVDEGLAVYYESTPGVLDAQFAGPLRRSINNDTLTSVRSLTGSFPTDAREAELAYAQSWSLVDYVFRKYGREKMAQLLQAFKTGGHYDDILKQVLGVDTDGLEVEWRQDIGARPRVIPTRSAQQPTAFPTFALSTDLTPSARATATPQSIAVNVTPGAQPTRAPAGAPANPINITCGSGLGLLALGLLGARTLRSRRGR